MKNRFIAVFDDFDCNLEYVAAVCNECFGDLVDDLLGESG